MEGEEKKLYKSPDDAEKHSEILRRITSLVPGSSCFVNALLGVLNILKILTTVPKEN